MKDEHSNESPFQKKQETGPKPSSRVEFDIREYSVMQVALHQLIESLEKQLASYSTGDARLLALGFTAENAKATHKLLASAKSAFKKLEGHGIGLTQELIRSWEKDAGKNIMERLAGKGSC